MLTDSHCHLDHHYYKKDLDQVIERAKKARVGLIITNGIDYATNLISLKLAEKYSIVRPALGFYPEDALDREGYFVELGGKKHKEGLKENLKMIEDNKGKIIAIGEIGLDLYHGKNLEKQSESLREMIKLAIKLDKPIIVHTRKAEKETLDIIKSSKINPDKVILHCFSGKEFLVKQAIEKGYNFSIPANIVRAESFQKLAELCSLYKILTETDGPYLSPFKNEDKSFNRNEPAYIKEGLKKIAEIKGISEKECEKVIEGNFKRVFGL